MGVIVAVLAALCIAVYAGVFTHTLTFGTVSTTTATIVAAGADTSDAFTITNGVGENFEKFPTALTSTFKIVEENDSTWVSRKLQVSNDGTNWVQHTIMDTTKAAGVIKYTFSTVPHYYYYRIIYTGKMASGDTLTVGPDVWFYDW
jgi:arabinogalactan endo-1,4-beta-galactosidase